MVNLVWNSRFALQILFYKECQKLTSCVIKKFRDFPSGPVVKNLPSNAGDAGLIPGRGTKIPHAECN